VTAAEDRFLQILVRLRGLAFGGNPLQGQGLSLSQAVLLDWVAAHPGSGIKEIAAGLELTAPTISVAVGQLVEMGLLERSPDPADRRGVRIVLSPGGESLQNQIREFRRRKARRLLRNLSREEKEGLISLLERAIHGGQ